MSWDQGVQPREDMEPGFRANADALGEKHGKGEVQAVVWFGIRPTELILDYGEHGSLTVKVPA
jgi:hypothetical protein